MQSKLIINDTGRSFVLVFEPGEEVLEGLARFAGEYNLDAAHFSAIGALSRAVLGFWDIQAQDYHRIPVDEQVEVLTLTGNIAHYEGAPKVHGHIVLGKRDGSAVGGHLLEAYVRPTLEVMLSEAPNHLRRTFDAAQQLPLLRFEASPMPADAGVAEARV